MEEQEKTVQQGEKIPQEENTQQEQPTYILPQSKKRTIIPKVTSILALGVIFYLGILLNVSLLDLRGDMETKIRLTSLIILLAIVIAGIILSILKARKKYKFYHDKITFGKKTINYTDITNTLQHKDPFDKIFKTYSINLGNKFFLRHIPQHIDIQNYLKQLIEYTKKV